MMNTTTPRPVTADCITYSDLVLHDLATLDDLTRYTATVEEIVAPYVAARRTRTSHVGCDHENTKAARARCRRERMA